MDTSDVSGWPGSRWELSAAESYALLYGPRTSKPSQPLKLAVLEMVEVERNVLFLKRKVAVLSMGEGVTDNEVLLAVRDLYLGCGKTVFPGGFTGVEVKTLAEQAGKTYRSRKGFAEAVVMKALAGRGFFRREQRSFLRIITYPAWKITRSGEAERARLAASMRLGESQFGRWVDRQPNQALTYLGLMGPAILLMEPLHADLRRLREGYEGGAESGASGASVDASAGEDASGGDVFDLGDLDFGGFDLDALGDLDGAFDAIDSGVDAGGGDGGNGDGGNGGD